MIKPFTSLRSPRKALLGVLVVLAAQACAWPDSSPPAHETSGRITYVAPTPAPIEIFWIDSAGNIGVRGVLAVVPGLPAPEDPKDPKAGRLNDSCRASATANGNGSLTVCMEPTVGKVLAKELGLEWTSGTSGKP